MRIDSHCHVSPVWYEPVETLLFQMDRCGVERAVLIQLLGQSDNSYQDACVARHPDRLASVAGVETEADVTRAASAGASGVRLRPDAPEPLWREAERAGLAVSCVGPANLFTSAAFAERAGGSPELTIVLEHLGGLARPDVGDVDAALPAVLALARFPNLRLKVPGLGQLAPRPQRLNSRDRPLPPDASRPLIAALEAFGPKRMMWGTDFPVVASREGYANALAWTEQALPPDARASVMGETAQGVFFRA